MTDRFKYLIDKKNKNDSEELEFLKLWVEESIKEVKDYEEKLNFYKKHFITVLFLSLFSLISLSLYAIIPTMIFGGVILYFLNKKMQDIYEDKIIVSVFKDMNLEKIEKLKEKLYK